MNGAACDGCLARLQAVEDELGRVRERLAAVDLEDMARTTYRLRELMLTIGELIDEAVTRR